ncbi:hypothetical protein AMECASPLE_008443, partial [Ameca splendens]
ARYNKMSTRIICRLETSNSSWRFKTNQHVYLVHLSSRRGTGPQENLRQPSPQRHPSAHSRGFPDLKGYIVPPGSSGSSLGSPPSRTSLENPQRGQPGDILIRRLNNLS